MWAPIIWWDSTSEMANTNVRSLLKISHYWSGKTKNWKEKMLIGRGFGQKEPNKDLKCALVF